MTPVLLALLFTKIKTDSPFFVRPITGAISNAVFSGFITPEVQILPPCSFSCTFFDHLESSSAILTVFTMLIA